MSMHESVAEVILFSCDALGCEELSRLVLRLHQRSGVLGAL